MIELLKCECGGLPLEDPIRGEIVCRECGLVLSEREIFPEDFGFKMDRHERNNQQYGPPQTVFQFRKNSYIFIHKRDKCNRKKWVHLSKCQRYYRDTSERRVQIGVIEVKRVCTSLDLPPFLSELVMGFFRKTKQLGGHSIMSVIGGIVFYYCREYEFPIHMHEITEVIGENKHRLTKALRYLVKEFGLKLKEYNYYTWITRYCSELKLNGLEGKVKEYYQLLLRNPLYFSGKNPLSIIAGLLYYTYKRHPNGCHFTQKQIAEYLKITEVSLRYRYREFLMLFRER